MLTQKTGQAEASAPPATDPHAAPAPRDLDEVIAYFEGAFVPMWRTGRLHGRLLLVGGGFYAAYLAIVGIGLATG